MLTELQTGLTYDRLAVLMAYSLSCSEMSGYFAEFGVCQGGSLELLAKLYPKRLIYGLDGFNGLPKPGKQDLHTEGEFALSDVEFKNLERVFGGYPNVEILKGYSPDVFETIKEVEFAFVHIDVDLYESVRGALDFFWPRLQEGGILIFDDYGFPTTPGAKKAVDEWDLPCQFRGKIGFQGWNTGQYLIKK